MGGGDYYICADKIMQYEIFSGGAIRFCIRAGPIRQRRQRRTRKCHDVTGTSDGALFTVAGSALCTVTGTNVTQRWKAMPLPTRAAITPPAHCF